LEDSEKEARRHEGLTTSIIHSTDTGSFVVDDFLGADFFRVIFGFFAVAGYSSVKHWLAFSSAYHVLFVLSAPHSSGMGVD
jgi:hypothetical protein